MSRSEQLLECEVCGAVQVIDLRQYKDKAVTCTQCASPLDIDDLRKQMRAEPEAQMYVGHRSHVQVHQVNISRGTVVKAGAASGGISCGCVGLLIVFALTVSILPILATRGAFDNLNVNLPAVNLPFTTPEMEASQLLRGHSSAVTAIAYSPDGRYLASGSNDESVRVWDLAAGGSLVLTGHDGSIEDVIFSPDGKLLAVAGDEGVFLYEIPSGKRLNRTFGNYYFSPRSVAFSPDSKFLAIGDSDSAVWNVQTAQQQFALDTPSMPDDIVYSPDGTKIASIDWGNGAMLWDAQRGLLLKAIGDTSGSEVSLAFSPDGQKLAFNGTNEFFIYDLTTDTLATIDSESMSSPRFVAFSPDGLYLAVGDFFDKVTIWEVANQKVIQVLKTDSTVNRIAFSPDGATVAAATYGGTIHLWSVFPEKAQPFAAVSTSTPGMLTCFITAQSDVNLYEEPGAQNFFRYLMQGFQGEVDGQRSVNDVIWWHLRDGAWARSDFVAEDTNCASVQRM